MSRRAFSPDARLALGANLVAKREQLQLSQGKAADRADVDRTMLSRWENGKQTPDGDGLLRLAVAYGCPLDDFFGGVDERYDAIIERRIPPEAKQLYQAQIAKLKALTLHALELTVAATETPAPTPAAPAAGRQSGRGKSGPTRARRAPKRKK